MIWELNLVEKRCFLYVGLWGGGIDTLRCQKSIFS